MATSNRYGQRAALERSLGRRLALCPEGNGEWALANLDNSALTPRVKEWAVEQKKDLRCISIGMGISYFCFMEFGLFPALAGIGWVLDNKMEPIPFALYMKKMKKISYPRLSFIVTALGSTRVAYLYHEKWWSYVQDRSGLAELPLMGGRSAVQEAGCSYMVTSYEKVWRESAANPEARDALTNPSTHYLQYMVEHYANCLRRQRLQEQLQHERGIALGSPLLPVLIPDTGVPKTGRLVNGTLVVPDKDDEEQDEEEDAEL